MSDQNSPIGEDVWQFIQKYADTEVKVKLLLSCGRYPDAKLGQSVIANVPDHGRLDVEQALHSLVNSGVLNMHVQNTVPFYSLTSDQQRRSPVMTLAAYNWHQRQALLNRVRQGMPNLVAPAAVGSAIR
jgi:hypothetical protein